MQKRILGLLAILPSVLFAGPTFNLPTMPTSGYVPDRVLIRFKQTPTLEQFRSIVQPIGDCEFTIPQLAVHAIRIGTGQNPLALAKQLEKNPAIEYAEPDYYLQLAYTPNDPLYSNQWDKPMINAPEAWDYTKGDPNTIIAVLDSGYRLDHEDLQGQLANYWNVVLNNNDVHDDLGHGTLVFGMAGAIMDNNLGLAGLAPKCRFLMVKITSGGGATDSASAAGMTWAADHGARVVNFSLAGPSGSTTLQNGVTYLRNAGVVFVVAAGNNNNTSATYPGIYTHSIAVAESNDQDNRGYQSTYGTWVEVAAPGQNVWSTNWDSYSDYQPRTGTSYAAPLVTAEAGLIYGIIADPGERTTALADEVRNIIQSNCVAKSFVAYGRVDVGAAIRNSYATVSGHIDLDVWQGGSNGVQIKLDLRQPGTQTVVQSRTAVLDATGNYSVRFTKAGTFDLVASGPVWLNAGAASISLARGMNSQNFSLISGDITRDNAINTIDINQIFVFFGTVAPGSDIDGDGLVDLADLSTLFINYGLTGF